MDWTAINSRNLTDAQKAQRNAEIVADAPSMTTYELAAKYGITPSGMCSVLQNANVKPKPGYVSMKGLVKKGIQNMRLINQSNGSFPANLARVDSRYPMTGRSRSGNALRMNAPQSFGGPFLPNENDTFGSSRNPNP